MSNNDICSILVIALVTSNFILLCGTLERNATLLSVCLGNSVVLECKCGTNGNRIWLHCGEPFFIQDRLHIGDFPGSVHLGADYSLNISSAEFENEGSYECFCNKTAVNTYELIIEAPPDLYTGVTNATQDNGGIYYLESGKPYSIFCNGTGAKPHFRISWFLNNAKVDHTYEHCRNVTKHEIGAAVSDCKTDLFTYEIMARATLQTDKTFGNFSCVSEGQCISEGQQETISFSTYVVPHVSLMVAGLINPDNVYVEEGKMLSIFCNAKASRPAANLTLIANRTPLKNVTRKIHRYKNSNLFDTAIEATAYPTTEDDFLICSCRGEYTYGVKQIIVNISTYVIPSLKLTVNGTYIGNGSRHYISIGDSVLVNCQALGARPAVVLNWTIVGEVQKYLYSQGLISNDDITTNKKTETSLHLLPTRGKVTIICVSSSSVHPALPEQHYRIEIFITKAPNVLIILVVAAWFLFLPMVLGILMKTKGLKKYWQITSFNSTADGMSERNSDENNEERNDDHNCIKRSNVTLLSKLTCGGRMGYWKAVSSCSTMENVKFIAKSISESAQLKDLYNFRDIAKQVMGLEQHNNIVNTIGIAIEDVPYYIYQEYIQCGSLRNYMLRTYQQKRKSQACGVETSFSLQKEADTKNTISEFALGVTEGMSFLSQNKFRHPAVNSRKVLLTKSLTCKLYDFIPESMANDEIDYILGKDNPPLAWLPPEIVFLKQYSEQGDVWSLAVALWEIYSLGVTPYAGMTVEEIEKEIRNGKLLAQPLTCPGSVFGVMLASWDNLPQNRPTFEQIAKKMREVMDSLKKQIEPKSTPDETTEPTYFTLDVNNDGNDYVADQHVMTEV